MHLPLGKPGVSRFIFVALLLAFNWPLLSIPSRHSLLGWLFFFWGVTIVLLFMAARWNGPADGDAGGESGSEPGGEAAEGQGGPGQADRTEAQPVTPGGPDKSGEPDGQGGGGGV